MSSQCILYASVIQIPLLSGLLVLLVAAYLFINCASVMRSK